MLDDAQPKVCPCEVKRDCSLTDGDRALSPSTADKIDRPAGAGCACQLGPGPAVDTRRGATGSIDGSAYDDRNCSRELSGGSNSRS